MTARSRLRAVTTLLVCALATAGCTGGGPAPATPSSSSATTGPSASGTPALRHSIPRSVLRAFETPVVASDRHWLPVAFHDDADGLTVRQRRVPGCDTRPWPNLHVDRGVLDFAATIGHDRGYVVSRQLTVYRDVTTARRFTHQMDHVAIGCERYAGRLPESVEGGEFAADRFWGVTRNHDGTQFSWGGVGTRGRSATWVDVATRENNAVVFTRVMDPDFHGDPDIGSAKQAHPAFVAEVARQGNRSARLLAAFR